MHIVIYPPRDFILEKAPNPQEILREGGLSLEAQTIAELEAEHRELAEGEEIEIPADQCGYIAEEDCFVEPSLEKTQNFGPGRYRCEGKVLRRLKRRA
ncbi:MAG: hypothetical protein ACI4P6_03960 [Candidatus Spyradosoma sp.]